MKQLLSRKPLLLAVLFVGLALIPQVVSNRYYLHMINLAGIYTLITIGLNILAGYTGQVSMGQAGYFAIGAYAASLLMLNLKVSFWLALVAAILMSAVFGGIVGVPAMKLSGPYLVLATIGFGEIIRLVI